MNDFKFELGTEVKDTITGFSGVIMARTQWVNGCNVYRVQPKALQPDGKVQEAGHFDEPQLELVQVAARPVGDQRGGPERAAVQTNRF